MLMDNKIVVFYDSLNIKNIISFKNSKYFYIK